MARLKNVPHSEIRETWLGLPKDAQELFPKLSWKVAHDDYSRYTPRQLAAERAWNRHAIESFESTQIERHIWASLLNGDGLTAGVSIRNSNSHLRVDSVFYTKAHTVQPESTIARTSRPALADLAEAGIKNVHRSKATKCADDFRDGYVQIISAVRLDASLIPGVASALLAFSGAIDIEFLPLLLLPGIRALGYNEQSITLADVEYLRTWEQDPDSEIGKALGCHIAAYNATPNHGWNLMTMKPARARTAIRKHPSIHQRKVIAATYDKCRNDPSANAARIIARFWKMHLALHAISAAPYKSLPLDSIKKMHTLIDLVGIAARRASAQLGLPKQETLFCTLAGIKKTLPMIDHAGARTTRLRSQIHQ